MSWALAANWLAVAGLVLLTFGTGAQAWANLAEFRGLRKTMSEDALKLLATTMGPLVEAGPLKAIAVLLFALPVKSASIRPEADNNVYRLGRFLWLTEVWAIIMAGSALALAAAVIQLALAYQ